ncbi:MAG: PH domain-containing protein [Eubacteriales bacterium]
MRFDKYSFDQYSQDPKSISNFLMEGEQVLWAGKPKKNAFVINKSLKMFPIALIWLLFDSIFIGAIIASGEFANVFWFVIPFFAVHLIPVWMWLGNILGANRRWKNTEYAITDKRVILRTGVLGYELNNIYYTDIEKVKLTTGVIDRMLKVGDIHLEIGEGKVSILDIEDAFEVYKMLQKTVLDIQSDIHFPNELRPDVNPGYRTSYKGFEEQ